MLVLGVVGRSSGKEKEKKRVDEMAFDICDFGFGGMAAFGGNETCCMVFCIAFELCLFA